MFGWFPFALGIFNRFPARRAIVATFIIAWLFLPIASYKFPGIPDLTKFSATSYSALLSIFLFDINRLKTFRPGWWDIPILFICFSPIFTSLDNDLGLYNGMAVTLKQTVTWGIPYFIGRLYLGSLVGLRELAIGIFVGGLAYIPLCLFEVRLSPQLHRMVYGFFPHNFAQTRRYGGFRPQVFMQHGLEVGIWMLAATLIGIWLWRTGAMRQIFGFPVAPLLPILLGTFVLCKSTGAWALCILGLFLLFFVTTFRTALPMFLIVGVILFHLGTSTFSHPLHARALVDFLYTTPLGPTGRVDSLEFRVENEELLGDYAKQRFWLGWGGFDRNRPVNEKTGKLLGTPDSLFIVHFGIRGAIGVFSTFTLFLLPIVATIWRKGPVQSWARPERAPVGVLVIILLMYAADCLLNAMTNPIFILTMGGLNGYAFSKERVPLRRRRFPRIKRKREVDSEPQEQLVPAYRAAKAGNG
ncbi:MAG: O-antigen ligase domain-containing protein [Cyanobacteria bacterium J06641_5]